MAKKMQKDVTKGFKELFGNPKWIEAVEDSVDKQIKIVKSSFDKNFQKATKSLNIITKKDLNLIHSKLRSLEKRIEKLEGTKKTKASKSGTKSTRRKTKK